MTTRSRTLDEDSPFGSEASVSIATRRTATWRSIRSSSGPESLRWYVSTAAAVQRHTRTPSPAHPHGHGFVAATRVKRAGYATDPPERVRLIRPDSRGWRSAWSTGAWNSASSSRNKTP